MNLFELSAKLGLDSTDYERGIGAAKNGIASLEGLIKKFVVGFAVKKLIGLAEGAVQTGMAFDSAMSQVAATMGVTTDQVQELSEFAQKMGATTKFSAVESAQALNYMALAGYNAEKSMKMLPTVLQLASAGGMDLARASDMVTDAESALGLTSEQTAKMVDQMAKTASKSNTSVEQLGDAMLTIGGTAKFMAGGTDRLQTVLGLLADNGIKGTEAGTHLRNMILKLSSPTDKGAKIIQALGVSIFDASGEMRDMQNIMLDLNDAMSGLTQEDRVKALSELFNARDLSAVNALLGTSRERWEELGTAIAEASGSAGEMAGTQLDNLNGDITIMKSALEGVKIQFAQGITPAIRDVVQRVTKVLSSSKTQKFIKNVGEGLGNIIKVIAKGISNALPRLAKLFDDGGKKAKIFGIAIAGAITTIKFAQHPVQGLVSAMGMLVGVLGVAALTADDADKKIGKLTDAQYDNIKANDDEVESYKELKKARDESFYSIDEETQKVQGLWAELQTLVDENGKLIDEGYRPRVEFITGELSKYIGDEVSLNGDVIQSYKDIQSEIENTIKKKQAEAKFEAGAELAKTAEANLSAIRDRIYDQEQVVEGYRQKIQEFQNELYGEDYVSPTRAVLLSNSIEQYTGYLKEANKKLAEFRGEEYGYIHDIAVQDQAAVLLEQNNFDALNELYNDAEMDKLTHKARMGALTAEELADMEHEMQSYHAAVIRYKENLDAGLEDYSWEVYNEMTRRDADLMESWSIAASEAYKANHDIGEQAVDGIIDGVEHGGGGRKISTMKVRKAAEDLGYSAVDGFKSGISGLYGVGQNAVDSLTGAVLAGSSAAINAMRKLAGGMIDAAKQTLLIHSPSKVFKDIGRQIDRGLALGLMDEQDYVEDVAGEVARSTLAPFGETETASVNGGSGESVIDLLRDIRDNLGFDVVLEDGTIAGRIDRLLGQTAMRKARGSA